MSLSAVVPESAHSSIFSALLKYAYARALSYINALGPTDNMFGQFTLDRYVQLAKPKTDNILESRISNATNLTGSSRYSLKENGASTAPSSI
jgi:hypothetical protein